MEIKERTAERLNTELREHKQGIKYQLSIQTVFKRDVAGDDSGKRETPLDRPTYFNSKTYDLLYGASYTEIKQTMDGLPNNVNKFVEDFEGAGSGWTLFFIQHVELKIYDFDVIKGGNYIPLPSKIEKKHACINVENIDEYCFKWAILSALHHKDISDHHERVTKYCQYANELNEDGLVYPVSPTNKKVLKNFEEKKQVLINILGRQRSHCVQMCKNRTTG